ncbi:MAG: hypothetical protein HZA11_07840 [Nitrospirae bacterium]|nr:hypothetical protein [Nitrospirota bacterium]
MNGKNNAFGVIPNISFFLEVSMIVDLEGQIYKTGKTKNGKNYSNVLVKRPDGQSDSITVFSDKEHKTGTVFKGKINAYIQMCSEVV